MDITLSELYKQIQEFHKALGCDYTKQSTPWEKMQAVRNIGIAINQEVAELIDSFPWKPWRSIRKQQLDIENAKREVIDILFFMVELCEVFQIEPHELTIKFHEVLKNNYKRVQDYYYNNKLDERG